MSVCESARVHACVCAYVIEIRAFIFVSCISTRMRREKPSCCLRVQELSGPVEISDGTCTGIADRIARKYFVVCASRVQEIHVYVVRYVSPVRISSVRRVSSCIFTKKITRILGSTKRFLSVGSSRRNVQLLDATRPKSTRCHCAPPRSRESFIRFGQRYLQHSGIVRKEIDTS